MGTLSDRTTISRVLETANLEDGANLGLVKYTDGGYGIARDCKPLVGLYWKPGEIEQCLAEFSRLAGQSNTFFAKANSEKIAAKKRILVVDDEPEITDLLKVYLERLGRFEVHVENHSDRTLKTARDFHPDLILMDIMMPEPDGSEVAAFLQDDPQLRRVPIIFVTALVSQLQSNRPLFGFGRSLFLGKPINFEELLHHIDQSLQSKLPAGDRLATGGSRMCG
jgi:CheY-like chemotaxis protein